MLLHPFIDGITPSFYLGLTVQLGLLLVPVTEWNDPGPWHSEICASIQRALTCFIPTLECCFKNQNSSRKPVTRTRIHHPTTQLEQAFKKPRQVARRNLLDPWWSSLFWRQERLLGVKKMRWNSGWFHHVSPWKIWISHSDFTSKIGCFLRSWIKWV